jgi:hypothetical protein
VDKETRDKHYRIVGALEAIDRAMQSVQAMPCDEATRNLIDVARATTNKCVLSAWSYAEQRTTPGKEVAP